MQVAKATSPKRYVSQSMLGDDDAFSNLIEKSRKPSPRNDIAQGAAERTSISEQVAHRILSMVKSGNLRPGDRLPTEQQMSLAFGISRPPLREALKALTLMGVLESRQGGRYSITDLSPSRLIAPFNVMLSINDFDVHEHFEARLVVDLELVRLCALRASDEQCDRIMKHAVDGRAFLNDPVAFRLVDIEFHQSLNDGAANGMLAAMAQGLYDIGLDIRRVASEIKGNIKKSVGQHIEIGEAIAARDPGRAMHAYRIHLEHVRDTTLAAMRKINQS
jgi:GntR family transcriptional regulator, transcriptional repressor for pyruvate dehydrogenase complex